MRSIMLLCILAGCAHKPICGNPPGSMTVFENDKSCTVRIRQVTIGSDLKIPESLKNPGLVSMTLEWIEPGLTDGRISLGHFELVPPPGGGKIE
jgi:hypothetical protein